MKKNLWIIIAVVSACLFAFTGCKKDKDDSSPNASKSKIVGKWYYDRSIERDKDDNETDTEVFTDGEYLMFNEDGTAYDSFDGDYASWRVSDNQLILTVAGDQAVLEIKKLTNNQLVLYHNSSESEGTLYLKR
ncbi:lipocalin family protein [Mucilaginibacter litoreus]|uniref:Lipocalin family protein n=1 Tax=Mucilaginibacter litoreus TaxID=1048221 RepID=A0ABW3AWU4_9SPHI